LIVSAPTSWSDLKKDLTRRMDSAVEVLKKEFSGLRSGRASTSLLDPIVVEAYGQTMPLSQCGTVGVPEPRMLTVQVWDKGQVKAVEKAIRDAGLGLNPQVDGQMVRVPIPSLNEERRRELQKVAGKYAEQARVSVRNVRRDGMDALKKLAKDGHISEDETKKHEKEVQVTTDETIKKIDDALGHKEKEIMQV
jgi:ribosome recycling factor